MGQAERRHAAGAQESGEAGSRRLSGTAKPVAEKRVRRARVHRGADWRDRPRGRSRGQAAYRGVARCGKTASRPYRSWQPRLCLAWRLRPRRIPNGVLRTCGRYNGNLPFAQISASAARFADGGRVRRRRVLQRSATGSPARKPMRAAEGVSRRKAACRPACAARKDFADGAARSLPAVRF